MKGGLAFLAVMLAATPSVAQTSSNDVENCSTVLSQRWNEEATTHPIDRRAHVIAVQVSVPSDHAGENQSRASDALRRAFPSFALDPASGILAGCCQPPVIGLISFEDFERLRARRFAPLCELGRRFGSELVAVRVRHREPYRRRGQDDRYFFVAWSPGRVPDA